MSKSPKIESLSWGNIQVNNQNYKDVKIYPGGVRTWDWNETGTHHVPGIQVADVEELLEHGATVVILSKGINERLQTAKETKAYLNKKEIEYHILQTEQAVKMFNKLRTSKAVGALIHSTC